MSRLSSILRCVKNNSALVFRHTRSEEYVEVSGATGGSSASVMNDGHWQQAASGTHQNTVDEALESNGRACCAVK